MKIPYIPVYAYALINNEIVVYNWTAMYIGDDKYRVFYGKKKSRDYYNVREPNIEKLQIDSTHRCLVLVSFNNNDELKFINESLSLIEDELAREKNELISIKERLATEHYYCNRQTTLLMEIITSEKIKELANRIELFNELKGQYNEHN